MYNAISCVSTNISDFRNICEIYLPYKSLTAKYKTQAHSLCLFLYCLLVTVTIIKVS